MDTLITGEAAETLASEAIRIMADIPGAEPDRVRQIVAVVLARAAERAGAEQPVRTEQVISAVWDLAPWARMLLGLDD